jgi:UDP-N-acetylmuramoyl-L-alanyl-D-glutamate--2,6-diaminopimelate ligase
MTAKERHITVEQMLKDLPLQNVAGDMSRPVLGLSLDSRGVVSSGAFAAMKGSTSDGHDYITAATENGAQIILCEDWPRERKDNVTYVQIDNLRVQLSNIAANYYGRPADHLKMVAVTGTNGKTSVATMGYQALRHMARCIIFLWPALATRKRVNKGRPQKYVIISSSATNYASVMSFARYTS